MVDLPLDDPRAGPGRTGQGRRVGASRDRLRVVTVSHAYGTPERMRLLEAIAETHDVVLVAPPAVDTQVFGRFTPAESRTVEVATCRTLRVTRAGHFVFLPSWRLLRRLRPSLLQVEYSPWTPEFWSLVLPVLVFYPRAPIILYTRKNTRTVPRGARGLVERALTRVAMSRVDRILAVSHRAAEVFTKLGYGHVPTDVQGHMPIDGHLFQPHPNHDDPAAGFTVGYVGSVAPHKGVSELISAVRIARARLPTQVRLRIVGPMRDDALASLIADHDWIQYDGPIDNDRLPAILSGLDLFVMPSLILPDHEEHDALALLEAMAVEVACAASRSGNMPELIHDGRDGWLFPAGDVEALAALLVRVLPDADARRRVGRAARPTALAFSGLSSLSTQRVRVYEATVHA